MLIDAASTQYKNSGKKFRQYMRDHQSWDNTIEVVVASHPHADHIGYMTWVLNTYDVDLYVDNGNIYDSATFRKVEKAFKENGAGNTHPQVPHPQSIDFCPRSDVSAELLIPDEFGTSDDPNDNSVIVRIDYKNDSFLFVGDAEGELEDLLLDDPSTAARLDVDYLKAGHHGSRTSSSIDFLDAVAPSLVTISCGAKDVSPNTQYKHPRYNIVKRLLQHAGFRDGDSRQLKAYDKRSKKWKTVTLNKAVYVTIVDGDIVLESDGNGIKRRPPE